MINMEKLSGEERAATMKKIRDACETRGFFEVIRKDVLLLPETTKCLSKCLIIAHLN